MYPGWDGLPDPKHDTRSFFRPETRSEENIENPIRKVRPDFFLNHSHSCYVLRRHLYLPKNPLMNFVNSPKIFFFQLKRTPQKNENIVIVVQAVQVQYTKVFDYCNNLYKFQIVDSTKKFFLIKKI